jgi:hypothetical protein
MARRKPRTKRFNQRYGTRAKSDVHQQKNEAVLRALEADWPVTAAKPKKAAAESKPSAK